MDSNNLKRSADKVKPAAQTCWTYNQIKLTPPASGRRISDGVRGDLVAELRFYGSQRPAQVDHHERSGLEDGKWLPSSVVSFYCYEVGNSYVEGAPGRGMELIVLHCETWGLGKTIHATPPRVTHKEAPCPLEYKYMAFPGNDTGTHYFLCIIAWPSDVLLQVNPLGPVRTTAFILNSLAYLQPKDPEEFVQKIIVNLSSGRPLRLEEIRNIKVYFPQVPQQPNGYDCGLYPGYLLSIFLRDPERYLAHCMGEIIMQGSPEVVWKHDGIRKARKHLKSLIDSAAELRQAALDFSTDFLRSSN
ncbi:hypothetical protein FS837_011551 [Tulasnella sp. UAMH 9824]|nr:hypothetical protein FS837_011551 [Tulasnella sp. UAMH 9824]